ncbi:hypothetical protein OIDMADRAFT_19147 [Oidiodendron maius Zn]|uniref:Uncharacterized protein n=1 Tax=Oidiodendron maius (strain Zn) TaxID=913774 RepID=A0A0C3HDA3_OIDMZ|nr:hypothetical protein OIDMADRAFT_19147 [Oidiodendron maius Zn]
MSELDSRDLRSASHAFKRFKNTSAKYNHGTRPLVGDLSIPSTDNNEHIDTPRERYKKTRPAVMIRPLKFRHNHMSKPKIIVPGHAPGGLIGRTTRKNDVILESDEAAGKPGLATSSSNLTESVDSDILYSFEKQVKSPNSKGREVGLDELVDKAEEEWESGKIDRMVKEYEVLDRRGEKVWLGTRKGKDRGSQNHGGSEVEDEGFEVV